MNNTETIAEGFPPLASSETLYSALPTPPAPHQWGRLSPDSRAAELRRILPQVQLVRQYKTRGL